MTDKLTPRFELSVDGAPVPAEVSEKIIAITVRQDLTLADVVEVRLSNDDLSFTEGATFAEGKSLAVKLGYVETDLVLVGTGTIARRECEFPERGPAVVTIVAYDKRFVLKQGGRSRTWKDVKDSDVVKQIAADVGLSADVDATPAKHAYLIQAGTTDLAFIAERAQANGYAAIVDRENTKLSFKKPASGGASAVTLEWGKTLLSFRPRFSTAEQVGDVTVRGWDPATKKEVKGKATASDVVSDMGVGVIGAKRAEAHGSRPVLVTAASTSTDDATAIAKAYVNQRMQVFAEGQGAAQGETKLAAGAVVEIKAVGKRASGKYFVKSVFHHYEPKGFTTYFDFVRPGEVESPSPAPTYPTAPPPQKGDGGSFNARVEPVSPASEARSGAMSGGS